MQKLTSSKHDCLPANVVNQIWSWDSQPNLCMGKYQDQNFTLADIKESVFSKSILRAW